MKSLLAALAVLAALGADAAVGDLETSYASNGVKKVAARDYPGNAMVVDMVPTYGQDTLVATQTSLLRFRVDGTPDPTFGDRGSTTLGLALSYANTDPHRSIAVGVETVAVGNRIDSNGNAQPDAAFVMVTSTGIVDRTIGIPWPATNNWHPVGIAVDPQNRIVVGARGGNTGQGYAFARFTYYGALDPSFGNNGVAIFDIGYIAGSGFDNDMRGFVLDGSRIVALSRSGGYTRLLRILENGTLDASFGSGGMANIPTPGFSPNALAVYFGDIFVASGFSSGQAAVVKVSASGNLDTSFGTSGMASITVGTNYALVTSIAMYGNRILVAGGDFATARQFVARFLPDGTIDNEFGSGGLIHAAHHINPLDYPAIVRVMYTTIYLGTSEYTDPDATAIGSPMKATLYKIDSTGAALSRGDFDPGVDVTSDAYAAALQPDGKVLVAGQSNVRGSVARLNSDGSLDVAFGDRGFATVGTGARAMTLLADGRIAVTSFATGGTPILGLLLPNGTPDTSFATAGVATYVVDPSHSGSFNALALAPGGKYVMAGSIFSNTGLDLLVVRALPDGSLDPSFGAGGFVRLHVGAFDEFNSVAVQPDGAIVAAGTTRTNPVTQALVMRFLANGTRDPGFGSNGVFVWGPADNARASELRVMPGGQILFAGWSTFPSGPANRFVVGRLTPAGALDTAFGTGGIASAAPIPDGGNGAYSLAVQPDGRIIAGGLSTPNGSIQSQFSVARFLANGQLDTSYGSGGTVVTPIDWSSSIHRVLIRGFYLYAAGTSARTNSTSSHSFTVARYYIGRFGAATTRDADIDGNDSPDIMWSNTDTGATYAWLMSGTTFLSSTFITQVDPSWKIQAIADFNGDGHPDLVWRNTATGSTYVWYMSFWNFLSDAPLFNLPPEWVIQGVADFNGDGKPDFLLRNVNTGVAFVWFFNDATPIGDQFLFGIDPQWKVEGVADMNSDGQPDLLFRNMASGLAFAWNTQYAGGNLSLSSSSAPIFGIDPVWEIVQMADWNGDGSPDLLFRNRDTGVVFVWYMNGTTLAGSDFITQIDPSWEIVPRH